MAVEKSTSNGEEVGVAGVIHLNDTPGVLTCPYPSAIDLNNVFGSNNGERHQATKLGVLLDRVLIVLLNVVGEVVHGDTVVLNVLHDQLLRLCQLGGCEGVGLSDDGDDVAAGRQTLHELNVEFTETSCC